MATCFICNELVNEDFGLFIGWPHNHQPIVGSSVTAKVCKLVKEEAVEMYSAQLQLLSTMFYLLALQIGLLTAYLPSVEMPTIIARNYDLKTPQTLTSNST